MPSSSRIDISAPSSQDFSVPSGSGMDRSVRDLAPEETAQKELESQLVEVGNRLSSPPSDVEELLDLLDQAESLLARVDQSPLESMCTALYPAMKALVAKELLSHSHIDVRVSLASCFSEITRITASTDPYGENLLKDIFQMIVGAFKKLDDVSSRSYPKRVSVLETVADVRSFNLMLDFGFDDLILEMFQHFLKAIRSCHPENIFSSMETIMTHTLNESDDITSEILDCLLSYVKSDTGIPPIARSLGERVIGNCSRKLKPYLVEFMQNNGSTLSDYSAVVASIWQQNSNTSEFKEIYASGDCLADDSKLSEKIISDELHQESEYVRTEAGTSEKIESVAPNSSVSVVCNGTLPKATIGPGGVADHYKKRRIHKTNSLIQFEDTTCRPQAYKNRRPSRKSSRIKEADGFQSDILFSKGSDACLLLKTERRPETDPSIGPDNKPALISRPTTYDNAPVAIHPKKSWLSKEKLTGKEDGIAQVTQHPSSVFRRKGDSDSDQNAKETLPSEAINSEDGFIYNLADKPLSRAGKTIPMEDAEVGELSFANVPPSKKCDVTMDSGRKSSPQTNRRSTRESAKRKASEQQKSEVFPSKKEAIAFNESTELSLKRRFSTRRISKSHDKNQYHLNDSGRTNSVRKSARRSDKASNTDKGSDKALVGSKIEVWWPDDKMFYKGAVASFDPASKKHRIEYDDGDVEVLLLKDERWKFLEDVNNTDEGREIDIQRSHSSRMKSLNKNTKSSSDSTARHSIKTETPLKREGIPVSKPCDYSTGFIVKKGGSNVTRMRRSKTKTKTKTKASKFVSSSSDESFNF